MDAVPAMCGSTYTGTILVTSQMVSADQPQALFDWYIGRLDDFFADEGASRPWFTRPTSVCGCGDTYHVAVMAPIPASAISRR